MKKLTALLLVFLFVSCIRVNFKQDKSKDYIYKMGTYFLAQDMLTFTIEYLPYCLGGKLNDAQEKFCDSAIKQSQQDCKALDFKYIEKEWSLDDANFIKEACDKVNAVKVE